MSTYVEHSHAGGRQTVLAQVIKCMPNAGMALISLTGTAETAFAKLPYGATGFGAAVFAGPLEGTEVLCATQLVNGLHEYEIIGTANNVPRVEHDKPQAIYRRQDKATAKVLDNMVNGTIELLQDYGAGAPQDMLSGDVEIKDAGTGVGLSVRRSVATLSGDPLSYVEVGNDGATRLSGRVVETDTMLGERVDYGDLAVDNRAVSLEEAMGVTDAPFKEQALTDAEKSSGKYNGDNKLVPSDDSALPLYRMQHIAGAVVGGEEHIMVNFPVGDRHDASTQPEVLLRTRATLTGDLSVAASGRLCSMKTPSISAISQLGYFGKSRVGKDGAYADLREPWDGTPPKRLKNGYETLSDTEKERDVALYLPLMSDAYSDALADGLPDRGLSIYSREPMEEADRQPTDDAAYSSPEKDTLSAVKDPATGESSRRFDATSFISQEPNGDICIRDGYGSEIRMSHGNIYISPALDLFLRPGRDLSVMAGRHQSYNSQGSLTANTSDAMFVRSAGRMEVCANTSPNVSAPGTPKGLVVEARHGDAVVRSDEGLSLSCAGDLYLGRCGAKGTGPGLAQPTASGSVVIDAADNGTLYMNGGRDLIAEALKLSLCSAAKTSGGRQNSLLRLHGPAVYVATGSTSIMSSLQVCAPSGSVSIGLPRGDKTEQVRMAGPVANGENVVIGGQLVVNRMAKFNSQVVACKTLAAPTLACYGGQCANLSKGITSSRTFRAEKMPNMSNVASMLSRGAEAADAIAALRNGDDRLCSKAYMEKHRFAFPKDYFVDRSTVMPGMSWQQHTTGEAWREDGVGFDDAATDDVTMCYPGVTLWNDGKLSKAVPAAGGASTVQLKDNYRINAIRRNV